MTDCMFKNMKAINKINNSDETKRTHFLMVGWFLFPDSECFGIPLNPIKKIGHLICTGYLLESRLSGKFALYFSTATIQILLQFN